MRDGGAGTTPGYVCRCSVCGREERTGDNPLREGWPTCHGYTMTLIDTEAFKADIERVMAETFAPVNETRRQAGV